MDKERNLMESTEAPSRLLKGLEQDAEQPEETTDLQEDFDDSTLFEL